jgi:hypothetical protein
MLARSRVIIERAGPLQGLLGAHCRRLPRCTAPPERFFRRQTFPTIGRQFNLSGMSVMTLLRPHFPEFLIPLQAVPVGTIVLRCHKVEGMFLIPDGRCTVRCRCGSDTTELALHPAALQPATA